MGRRMHMMRAMKFNLILCGSCLDKSLLHPVVEYLIDRYATCTTNLCERDSLKPFKLSCGPIKAHTQLQVHSWLMNMCPEHIGLHVFGGATVQNVVDNDWIYSFGASE